MPPFPTQARQPRRLQAISESFGPGPNSGIGAICFNRDVAVQALGVTAVAALAAFLVAHVTFPWLGGTAVGGLGSSILATTALVAAPISVLFLQVIQAVRAQRRQIASREILLAKAQRFADLGYWELCPASEEFRLSDIGHEMIGDPQGQLRLTFQTLLAMSTPEDRPALAVALERMLSSDARQQVEFGLTGHDGRQRTIRLIGTRSGPSDGTALKAFGAFQDITDRRAMEAALRASEDHYRHAVDLNPQIPWMEDADGNSLEISPRWLELTGLSIEDSSGTNWLRILHPDDHDRTMRVWQGALDAGHPYDVDYRLRLADGAFRWFRARASARRDDAGKVLCWYGTLEDIHERKMADVALRDSEAFASSILNGSTDCVEVIDLDGRFRYMNPPGLRLLEIGAAEPLLGQDWTMLWPGEAKARLREAVAVASGGVSVRFTGSRPTEKVAPRWWDVCLSPIPGPDGRPARLLCTSRDVTANRIAQVELEQAKEEAENAARRLSDVLESTTDCVIILDNDWRIRFINQRACAIVPSEGRLIGENLWQLLPKLVGTVIEQRLKAAARGEGPLSFEEFCEPLDAWVELHAYPAPAGLSVFFRDVTSKRNSLRDLEYMAHHDSLTGLLNRPALRTQLDMLLSRTSAECPTALLLLDLDEFKSVNDSLGHPAGDQLLRAAAARLQACLRGTDIVARFGGDEFAVVQPSVKRHEDLEQLAARIIGALSEPYLLEDRYVVVGASVGVALAEGPDIKADDLLKRADIALYQAKADGRGVCRQFEPGMDKTAEENQELRADLRSALVQRELRLFFQPILNLQTSDIAGFEALLRWQHPRRGFTTPGTFIAVAEMTGAIIEIDRWVLREACAAAVSWPGDLSVSVNLSPSQFRDRSLLDAVSAALSATGLPAERLRLEITEAALLQDSELVREMLAGLRRMGARISIDDFGTGYSSLSYLRRFPVDNIKIDRSFVADLHGDARTTPILRAITTLGQDLGISITAEGIETAWQAGRLRTMGCHEGQGYFFGRPMDERKVGAFVAEHRSHEAAPFKPARA